MRALSQALSTPWWLRWLWINLMLAAVVSACYLLAVSVEEHREWLGADGYLERRREGRGALIVVILLFAQVVGLRTAYRSGGRAASRLALAMAGLIGVALLVLRWFEHQPLFEEGMSATLRVGWEGWLIAYILTSHLAFALAGALRCRARPQSNASSLN